MYFKGFLAVAAICAASATQAASVKLDMTITITGTNVSDLVSQNATAFAPLIGNGVGDSFTAQLTVDEDDFSFVGVSDTTIVGGRQQAFSSGDHGDLNLSGYAFDLLNTTSVVLDDRGPSSGVFDQVILSSRSILNGASFAPLTTQVTNTSGDVVGMNVYTSYSNASFVIFGRDSTGSLFEQPSVVGGVAALAQAPSVTSEFRIRLSRDDGGFLDLQVYGDVDVTATMAPVPLPAGLPMLLTGVAGLVWLKRRKRLS